MTMIGSDTPPNAVDWQNLIRIGRELLTTRADGTTPTEEHSRRATSNAYYAMFHALAMSNADALMGTVHDSETEKAWLRIYRGLDHGTARRELQRHRQEFSASVQTFVETFQDIQDRRHSADYNPSATFSSRQVAEWLESAEATIVRLLRAERSERAYIAALTLVRGR